MRTYPDMMKKIAKILGKGCVVHHTPTPENPLGQSGIHTFVMDVLDVVDQCHIDGHEPYRELYKLLLQEEE